MTRKDYVVLARTIKSEYQRAASPEAQWALESFAASLANELKADNPRFDRDRFYAAAFPPVDETPACEGHADSLDGAHMGETVYCDGSCRYPL